MHEILTFFKYLATSNFINFVIMLVILGWIISKMKIGKTLDENIAKIETAIKDSEHQKLKSVRHLDLIQNAMERLPQKITDLQQDFCVKTAGLSERINLSTDIIIKTINDNIDKSVEVEEKKLSQEMTQTVINNSIEQAVSKIRQELEQNPDKHYEFINESLDELNKAEIE